MPVIKYQEFIPHAILQDEVKRFWILEKAYTPEDSVEDVIPDASIELILNFGSPYIQMGSSTPRQLPNVCLIGLQDKPLLFQANGVVKIVAARFFAWGVLPFFEGEAWRERATTKVAFKSWRGVVSKMAGHVHAGEYSEAVDAIQDFLIGKRLNTLYDPQQVKLAAKLLYRTKGRFRVAELADYCNLSLRQLERQFDGATGVSPKTLARTIRFEAVRDRLMFEPETHLTNLAYEFGYTDQAHLINEFKAFARKTPSQYAAEMRKLHALFHDHEHVVFLQSPPALPDYNGDNLSGMEEDDCEG